MPVKVNLIPMNPIGGSPLAAPEGDGVERFRSSKNIEVVRGVLPDTLDDKCPDKIAYLHVDLNAPASYNFV